MATVLRHELVLKRNWIAESDFLQEFSTATLVPGAIAVNLAFLQGRRLRGWKGAAASVAGTVLPSFTVILLVAYFAVSWFKYPAAQAFFKGCAIAVGAQIAFVAYVFGRKRLRRPAALAVCLLGLFPVAVAGLHPVFAVLVGGAAGLLLCKAAGGQERKQTRDSGSEQ